MSAAPVLLLSDLHLPNVASPLRDAFLRFLDGPARASTGVYILGDLFEYWIGDAEGLSDYAAEVTAMRRLSDSGVPIAFMHGNRDFLVGTRFARAAGITLLPDPLTIELGGIPTLLSHGDLYCTADVAYQRWRLFSRNPLAQFLFRNAPGSLRRLGLGAARSGSDRGKRNKAEGIMDVSTSAIVEALTKAGVRRMIHGHTHRPAEHQLSFKDGTMAERIVLADWRPERLEYLTIDPHGWRRMMVPAAHSSPWSEPNPEFAVLENTGNG